MHGPEVRPAAVSSMPDDVIVAKVIAGDTAAFELLMRRHNQRVFRATRAVLRNDDDAEDAMQAAYLAAFTHLKDFGGRAAFSTWLTRIAVHEAFAKLRKSKRTASLDDVEIEEEEMTAARSPEEAASDVELRGLLEEAVDSLPLGFRTVFVMRAVEEMSAVDVAEALGIPEETVRTRLHRARGLLRDRLAKKLEDAAPNAYAFHLSRCDRVVANVLFRLNQENGK